MLTCLMRSKAQNNVKNFPFDYSRAPFHKKKEMGEVE